MMNTLPTVEELYRGLGRMTVRFYGRMPGSRCVEAPSAILGCSGLDSVFLNCGIVYADGPDEDGAEARLREFVARIRESGVGGYVCLSELVQTKLEPLARELALEPLPPIPLMARGVEEPGEVAVAAHDDAAAPARARPVLDPAAFVVERVASHEDLCDFLAVSEAAFDLPAALYGRVVTRDLLLDPALSVYVCRLEGAPVCAVCVLVEDGLAGISGMATPPGLQGRGIGSVLLAEVIALHRHEVRAFYLTASEAGQRLYRRHGFTTMDAATAWVVPPPGA